MKIFLLLLCFAAVTLLSVAVIAKKKHANPVAVDDKAATKNPIDAEGFVLMELFTSQGCSSCPPADELLGRYAEQHNNHIIALAFHVDYWNRLGWKDTFSMAAYSERQHLYEAWLGNDGIYTPQLVLNGQKELVGSDAGKVASDIELLLKQKPAVSIIIDKIEFAGNKVMVSSHAAGNIPSSSINAVLVEEKADTKIIAGENKGILLSNHNIVRDFVTTGYKPGIATSTLQIPAGMESKAFSIVLFLQEQSDGKISCAIQQKL